MSSSLRVRAAALIAAAAMLATVLVLQVPGQASTDGGRIAGADRLETSALAATSGFRTGTEVAILARADDYPDALAAAGLAGQLEAPVVLTGASRLAAPAKEALKALEVSEVVLLGGSGALGPQVGSDLQSLGLEVRRLEGPNRYATAATIAEAMDTAGSLGGKRTAFLASGENFPDALSAGPLAYAGKHPLLLTRPGRLPQETVAALDALDIERVILLGGKAAISADVGSQLEALAVEVDRVSGQTRDGTAARLARFAIDQMGFSANDVIIVRQDTFPDALSAGPLGGKTRSPILLSQRDALALASAEWLTDRCGRSLGLRVLGGRAVVSDAAVAQARDMLSGCQTAEGRDEVVAAAGLSDPSSVPAEPSGSLRVTEDGAVVENRHLSAVIIEADDVTLRNVRVTSGERYGVTNTAGHPNLRIEDSELVCTSAPDVTSACLISWGSHTVRGSYIEAYGADAVKTAGDATYEGNHIVAGKPGGSDHHTDGIQTRRGDNLRIVGNVIDAPARERANAALIIQAADGDIRGVEIRDNWLSGGNYTVYTTEKGRSISDVRITGNVFAPSKDDHPLGFRYGIHRGNVDEWSGNVWLTTGRAANP